VGIDAKAGLPIKRMVQKLTPKMKMNYPRGGTFLLA
jgi:hypothetical protein